MRRKANGPKDVLRVEECGRGRRVELRRGDRKDAERGREDGRKVGERSSLGIQDSGKMSNISYNS